MSAAKRKKWVIVALVLVFGGLVAFNFVRIYLKKRFFEHFNPFPVTISTTKAVAEDWHPSLSAAGSLEAVNGVDVSSEVSGMVMSIHFKSGQMVEKGQSLLQLDDSTDVQDLKNSQATLNVDQLDYNRKKILLKQRAISQSDLDDARAAMQSAQASVNKALVSISKKNIRAPFSGKIGILEVNIGQYINPGEAIASLQSLDPLYVNFTLPEQHLKDISVGQKISVSVDAYPDQKFYGTVTAINSSVTESSRSIEIQGTIPNQDFKLYPGSFADVRVYLPAKKKVVTLPQTAVTYSLYGDIVYKVKTSKDESGKTVKKVYQKTVTVGDQANNKVIIDSGIQAGDEIVDSGQLKLSNGTTVNVNNSTKLTAPKPAGLNGG